MSFGSKSLPPPTEHEQDRMDAIRELGCLIGHLRGYPGTPTTIQHLVAGKRRGHRFTIGLNPWSHQGTPFNNLSAQQCFDMFGPSLAGGSATFREAFGTDDELLEAQDALLLRAGFVSEPLPDRYEKRRPKAASSKILSRKAPAWRK